MNPLAVLRIVALKEIIENLAKYHFSSATEGLYGPLPTHQIDVDGSIIDLAEFTKGVCKDRYKFDL